MDDGLEVFSFLGVIEYPGTQSLPVELAIWTEHSVSEAPADVGRCWLTRSGDIVGDSIGIDSWNFEKGKAGQNPRFAGSDTAGQGNPEESHELLRQRTQTLMLGSPRYLSLERFALLRMCSTHDTGDIATRVQCFDTDTAYRRGGQDKKRPRG